MKRTELEKIDGLSKEQIDAIMGLHQNDVTSWNSRLTTQKTELDSKDKTIEELTNKVKEYDGVDVKKLQTDIANWQQKYNDDMAKKDKEYAKKTYFNGINFASELARKQAMKEFDEKNLPFENGSFLGADDFIKGLREADPKAFIEEKQNQETGAQKLTTGIQLSGGKQIDSDDPITRRFKELNPGIKI